MNPADPEKSGQSTKSRLYFVVGFILLALMAALWSVDPSVVYILLGGAAFFLFLGFWNRPRQNAAFDPYKNQGRSTRYTQVPSSVNFWEEIGKFFNKTDSSPQQRSRMVPIIASVFIFFVFFTIFIAVIFSSDDSFEYDDEVIFQKAEQFRWSSEYDSAVIYYRQLLTRNPEHVQGLMGLGNVWLAKQSFDSARVVFERVPSGDESYNEARYGQALSYYYQKEYKKTMGVTSDVFVDDPAYNEPIVLSGDSYYAQKRYDSAFYWYDVAYGQGHRTAWLCHVLGYLYGEKNNQQKAVELYKEALIYDSTRVDIYQRLGEIYPGPEGQFYRKKYQQLKSEGYE
jgi:tetratricopeptide (TPR) repeat protein